MKRSENSRRKVAATGFLIERGGGNCGGHQRARTPKLRSGTRATSGICPVQASAEKQHDCPILIMIIQPPTYLNRTRILQSVPTTRLPEAPHRHRDRGLNWPEASNLFRSTLTPIPTRLLRRYNLPAFRHTQAQNWGKASRCAAPLPDAGSFLPSGHEKAGTAPDPPGSSVPAVLKPSKGFQRAGIPRNRRAGILTHDR